MASNLKWRLLYDTILLVVQRKYHDEGSCLHWKKSAFSCFIHNICVSQYRQNMSRMFHVCFQIFEIFTMSSRHTKATCDWTADRMMAIARLNIAHAFPIRRENRRSGVANVVAGTQFYSNSLWQSGLTRSFFCRTIQRTFSRLLRCLPNRA